jgi:multicomponent Na+:H+ antiporter subunit G
MGLVLDVLGVAWITFGVAFLGISAVGVVHLPGFFARAHAVAKSETLGIISVLGGLAVLNGFADGTPQLIVIIVIAFIANPTAVHALARAAAFRSEHDQGRRPEHDPGRRPEQGEVRG